MNTYKISVVAPPLTSAFSVAQAFLFTLRNEGPVHSRLPKERWADAPFPLHEPCMRVHTPPLPLANALNGLRYWSLINCKFATA
jgi:hypothetical protein